MFMGVNQCSTLISPVRDLTTTMSQDRKPQGRVYTDDEWEKVKQPFYHYYMEKNLPLKEAAKLISQEYHFDATPRQWERRIAPEKWNFTKYANRDERLKQIRQSGKSLLEVSHRGRRKSTASDGRPLLNEDRNLRRFARREVSRSRPRAKSVGTTSDASDQEMLDISAAPSPDASESSFYSAEPLHSTHLSPVDAQSFDDPWISKHPHEAPTGPVINISDMSVSNSLPQIIFSVHDEIDPILHEPIHVPPDKGPSMQFTQADIDSTFPSFYPTPSNENFASTSYGDPYVHPINDPVLPWNDSVNFSTMPNSRGETFPDLPPDSTALFNIMTIDDPQSQSDVRIQLTAADNDTNGLVDHSAEEVDDVEPLPNFDNTYADVYELLHDQQMKVLQMLGGCISVCESAAGNNENLKKIMLEPLRLLERGIRAQSEFKEKTQFCLLIVCRL